MLDATDNKVKAPEPPRQPALTLKRYNGQTLNPTIDVILPHNLSAKQFLDLFKSSSSSSAKPAYGFPALHNWFRKTLESLKEQENKDHPFHKHMYRLKEIDVQAVDWFWQNKPGKEDKLGFMKIQTKIQTEQYVHEGKKEKEADWLPGAVFLRGGSVGILIIVQPEDAKTNTDEDKQIILTIQPRIPAGSLAFSEIPAGMLGANSFTGSAAAELEEEANLKVKESELINLSELAAQEYLKTNPNLKSSSNSNNILESAMYPSPGACDEFIPLFLCQKRLTRNHMNWLQGKATGLRDEGENITLKIVPLKNAWKELARDGKGLAALALYEGLRREKKIGGMPTVVEPEPEEARRKR